jgi:ATP-binding cassette subfamily B protein RaxB
VSNARIPIDIWRNARLPVIRQSEAAECGLACLAMISCFHGCKVDLHWLRNQLSCSLKGLTLKDLIAGAAKLGFSTRPLKVDIDELEKLRMPCILHWGMNHFVVLRHCAKGKAVVHDPAIGAVKCNRRSVSDNFSGIALELTPAASFEPRDHRKRLRFTDIWRRLCGLTPAIIQLLVLSVMVQAFALAAPFYMQLVVDEVLSKSDENLLVVLATGFGLLTVLGEAVKAVRAFVVLYVSNMIGIQFVSRLFSHLLKLPVHWFEKRHVGDVISRFSSTRPIQEIFSEGLVSAAIDGVMAVSTLALIFLYSARLGSIVLAATSLYVLIRLAFFEPLRRRNEELIAASAKEQSTFIESVRGIQSIKIFGCEPGRQSLWQNRYADVINSGVRLGKMSIGFTGANGLLFGLENIAIVYVGALLVLDAELTVGMFFAFMAYKRHFIENASSLIERLIEFRLLDLHLSRISDIALSPPEHKADGAHAPAQPTAALPDGRQRIELRDVSFRYSDGDPWLIRKVSLTLAGAEMISIVGSSGSGKTTLMKLILGLIEPASGKLLCGDHTIANLDKSAYRRRIGTVLQDDTLFAGTVAENICLFDTDPDHEKIHDCAEKACIRREVLAMPMGFNSLVGDMGSALSAGQQQRLLLARALYRSPGILILDEGTANLDSVTETKIIRMLRELSILRICVAHRERMIAASDRVLMLHNGAVHEIERNQLTGRPGTEPGPDGLAYAT